MEESEAPAEAPEAVEPDLMGHVPVSLEGVEYVMRPSWEAIMSIEKQTGKTLLELSANGSTCLSLSDLSVCVCEMMHAQGKVCASDDPLATTYRHCTTANIAKLIMKESIYNVNFRVSIVLMGAITGAYDETGEPQAMRKMK